MYVSDPALNSVTEFLPSVCVGEVAKVVKSKMHLSCESSLQEKIVEDFPAMLETTAAVHPGGSGGAVVNSEGRMIGLITRYWNNFFVKG